MTDPTPPGAAGPAPDPLARSIDATAATTNAAIGRAASAGSELVDKAADAAKTAERGVRSGGRAALDVGQDAVRAGLGVAGAVGDQAGKLLAALVDRGAQLEQRVVEQVKSTAKEATEAVRTRVDDVRQAVDPRAEHAELRAALAALAARVDALEARLGGAPGDG